ncbi:MAG: bifunctional tetrahydrofolate synthase/dihydrofolate synthase, partial [Vibrio casei]
PSSLKGPRAAQEAELCQYLSAVKGHYQTPVEAFKSAQGQAQEDDVLLVVGSFHTVGEVLNYWHQHK